MKRSDHAIGSVAVLMLIVLMSAGCRTAAVTTGVYNAPTPNKSTRVDPQAVSDQSTVNIESNEIIDCAKAMVGEMLANPTLNVQGNPRSVTMDASYFTIESTQRIDRNLVINRLRTEMIQAANGRIRFIGRQNAAMVEEEQDLAAEGVVKSGAEKYKQASPDFRLAGSIREHVINTGGSLSKYHLMTFEMISLKEMTIGTRTVEQGEIVHSGQFEFKKELNRPSAYR